MFCKTSWINTAITSDHFTYHVYQLARSSFIAPRPTSRTHCPMLRNHLRNTCAAAASYTVRLCEQTWTLHSCVVYCSFRKYTLHSAVETVCDNLFQCHAVMIHFLSFSQDMRRDRAGFTLNRYTSYWTNTEYLFINIRSTTCAEKK